MQTRYLKAPYFYQNLGIDDSLATICDPYKHKILRGIISPLFSKQSLDKLAPLVGQIVERAAETVLQRSLRGEPINIQKLYRCITVCLHLDERLTLCSDINIELGRYDINLALRSYARPHRTGSE